MELDIKHKNIGATADILRILREMMAKAEKELPEEMVDGLGELFRLEAKKDCDYLSSQGMICMFNSGKPIACYIEDCPLKEHLDLKGETLESIEGRIKQCHKV